MSIQEIILEEINRNQNGDYYIIFRLPKVKRGIRGKSKGQVDELLIVGVPQKKIDAFLKAHYRKDPITMNMTYPEIEKELERRCQDAISSEGYLSSKGERF